MKNKIFTNVVVGVSALFLMEAVIFATPTNINRFIDYISKVFPLRTLLSGFLLTSLVVVFLLILIFLGKLIMLVVKIFRTRRADLVVSLMVSIGLGYLLEAKRLRTFYVEYKVFLDSINVSGGYNTLYGIGGLILLVITLISACLFSKNIWKYVTRHLGNKTENNPSDDDKLSDDPWIEGKEDVLGYQPSAAVFADKVRNCKSESGVVFGLEAPWGAGKTSFLNMCKSKWKKDDKKLLVVDFNPWHFSSEADLIKKYFSQLKTVINKRYYAPELNKSISRYTKLISSIGVGSFNFRMPADKEDVKEMHDSIGRLLKELRLHIVVIVDDLDRIPLEKARQMLKLVALCADFSNIKYILCYDLDNLYSTDTYTTIDRIKGVANFSFNNQNGIGGLQPSSAENINLKTEQQIDSAPLQSYLEKIINVKHILPYYQREGVMDFLVERLYDAFINFENIPDFTPFTKQKLKEVLVGFFNDNPFIAKKYVFSLRQVKAIVKTFLSSQFRNPRFFAYDIRQIEQLVLLMILKYYFPKVYTDICFYEYGKDKGFFFDTPKYRFTAVKGIGDDKITPTYKQYVNDYAIDTNAADILGMLFDVTKTYNSQGDYLDTYHLNQYIKIIEAIEDEGLTNAIFIEFFKNLDPKKPEILIQQFYDYIRKVRHADTSTVEGKILQNKMLSEFFKKLMGKIYEVNKIDDKILKGSLDGITGIFPRYSLYESENISEIRDHLLFVIMKILNDGVWNEKGEGHNSIENIKAISGYLIKDGTNVTIPEKLGNNRGVIGIYEMLHLRYSCNHSRGGSLWEITRSLMWHKLTQNGTKASIADAEINQTNDKVALEEISLHTFSVFKENYIDKGKNFVTDVESLSAEEILGEEASSDPEWLSTIKQEEKFEERIGVIKAQIEIFTLYDLCFDGNYHGMKCGGYVFGDKKIRDIMQEYLFEKCFVDPTNQVLAYEGFVNILLRSFESQHFVKGLIYKFDIKKTFNMFDEGRILSYWKAHRDSIKEQFKDRKGRFYAGGYVIFYDNQSESESDLTNSKEDGLFDILDKAIEESADSSAEEVL